MPREWPANAPQEIAVEQLQRVIEPGPTDLRRDAMWPVGRRRGARIQPWHFEVARPTFQPRPASTPNIQCRDERKRRMLRCYADPISGASRHQDDLPVVPRLQHRLVAARG